MKKKKLLLLTGFIFLGLIFGFLFLRKAKPLKVQILEIQPKTLRQAIAASGKVKSNQQIDLKFQTSGQLAWVGVKEGDKVKKWQALASLDKGELERELRQELLDYLNERWDFQGDRETYNVTTDNLDKYTLSNAARRILEKAQFDLNRTVLDVEIADTALKLATLITPIEGIVTHIDIPVAGVNITPATAVFTVADPQDLYFEAEVDEVDVGPIKVGQKVILTLDAYPEEEIASEVEQISFQSTTTKGGGTVFLIKLKLPENKEQKFKLGMNGDAEITLAQKEKVLVVPSTLILEKGNKDYLFRLENNRAKEQEVKIGWETETETEILEGLKLDDQIIAEKPETIKNGQKVK